MGATPFFESAGTSGDMPRHVAIIMDGNGRWAAARGLARTQGHRQGFEAVRHVVEAACECGVAYLTLYAFSTENWQRPRQEVNTLIAMVRHFVKDTLRELHAQNVCIRVIGRREDFPKSIVAIIDKAEKLTEKNTRLRLTVALSYGARAEITKAVYRVAKAVRGNSLRLEDIDSATVQSYLETCDIPDPDLLIRTGGEKRMSNFLLWQSAYTELLFLDTYWPDFSKQSFKAAMAQFQQRQRRFGAIE